MIEDSALAAVHARAPHEVFISVDVETAGPTPARYSLLSIGACVVDRPELSFYVELAPVTTEALDAALAVSGLSMAQLAETGIPPAEAMGRFADWLSQTVPSGASPIFVGFNAAFDWMFVADYFERFHDRNPFGHAALDIKSYFMGVAGSSWERTSMRHLAPIYLDGRGLSHNALADARDQAQLFLAIQNERTRQ
ncbi:MAG: 3'-5' exonuclease [Salinibacterium sp.]|nr:3'-5' exonuclease [Salinibacterium sp.]